MIRRLILSLLVIGTLLSATNPTQESVTKLYIATFDRVPDRVGLDYWVISNLSLEEIAESFFEQEETQKKYPKGTTTEEFINSIYKNLFTRDSDEIGLEYWKRELESERILKPNFILAIINGALDGDAVILKEKQEISKLFLENNISKEYNKDVISIYNEEGKVSAIKMIDGLHDNIIEEREVEEKLYLEKITKLLETDEYDILKRDLKDSIISSVVSESTYQKAKIKADKLVIQYKLYDQSTLDREESDKSDTDCKVKGNISYNHGTKYYFLSSHRDYSKVQINRTGEQCFLTEDEAIEAGWIKAPE